MSTRELTDTVLVLSYLSFSFLAPIGRKEENKNHSKEAEKQDKQVKNP